MSRRIRIIIFSALASVSLLITLSGCDIFNPSPSPATGTDIVDEAWNIISREYVEPDKVNSTTLSRSAVEAMVDALNDPYTTYLDPDEYQINITHQQGTFSGIGATVGVRDGRIIVVAPIEGTPAARAGIRSGDVILAVNGESIEGLSVEEVVLQIRGPEGTPVRITIQHVDESSPVEVNIVRAVIDVPSITYELRDTIAYIRISYFSERTDEEMMPLISRLKDDNATGIIIDLRSNPGGPVDTVVNIASYFLDKGVVMYLVDNDGNETSYSVAKTGVSTNLPMVLLTDNYSASGSEVLSGALQDYDRAVVAGTVTYGKGSADRWFELSDGSAIYLTVSRWLTPNHRLIEGKGIEPDYPLDLEGDALVQWAMDYLNNGGS